ncbi:MAG TPA: DinB family protein [Acidimicrobiales bacterium]
MADPVTATRDELLAFSEYAWGRTRERLDGLTDDEYLWEPVANCWSLRPRDAGTWRVDIVSPPPDPAPFTTIAWRLAHLIQCYGQRRNAVMLSVDDAEDDVPWLVRRSGAASEAIDALETAHERWTQVTAQLDDVSLAAEIGPVGGPYEKESRAAFVLHMIDEFIHHAAEVATLRDLYAGTTTPAEPPATVTDAAALGHWHRVIELVDAGAPVDVGDTTALHYAAGAGDADVVRLLLERGADKTVRDPQFGATPAEWATYFGHPDVATLLAP